MAHSTASHALIEPFRSTYCSSNLQIKCFCIWDPLLQASSPALMAKPKLQLLLLFFFLSILQCFFRCESSSQLDLEDEPWLDEEDDEVVMVQSHHDSRRRCDFSIGKWVYDQSYPLYDSNCPYLSAAVTCQKNGRPDSDYEKWKWKPQGCSVPRYMQNIC